METNELKWPVRKYHHTPEELAQVQKEIMEELGHEPYVAAGYFVAIWIYERKAESDTHHYRDSLTGDIVKTSIVMDVADARNEKWNNFVGKVIYLGDDAYTSGKYKDCDKPLCKLGDWVTVPRHEGTLLCYRGKPIMVVPDDRIMGLTPNPLFITRFQD